MDWVFNARAFERVRTSRGRREVALYRIGRIRRNLGVRCYTQLFDPPDLAALDGCWEWLQQALLSRPEA